MGRATNVWHRKRTEKNATQESREASNVDVFTRLRESRQSMYMFLRRNCNQRTQVWCRSCGINRKKAGTCEGTSSITVICPFPSRNWTSRLTFFLISSCSTASSNCSAETTQQNFISRLCRQTSTKILLGPISFYVTSSHLWFRRIEHRMNFYQCLHSRELLIPFLIPSKLNSNHRTIDDGFWASCCSLCISTKICFISISSLYLGFFGRRVINDQTIMTTSTTRTWACFFLTNIMTIPHCVDIFKALIRAGWHREIERFVPKSGCQVGTWYTRLLYFDQEQVSSKVTRFAVKWFVSVTFFF